MDKGFSRTIEFAEKKQKAFDLLISKAKEVERIPVKDDFTEEQVMLVKDALGPFPRALETAGLDFGQTPAPDVSGITIDAQGVMHFGGHS